MKRKSLWTHHGNEHLIGTTVTDGRPDACSRVHPGSKPLRRVTSIPKEDDCRRGERRRSSASPEPFFTASASVGRIFRGRNRSACHRSCARKRGNQ